MKNTIKSPALSAFSLLLFFFTCVSAPASWARVEPSYQSGQSQRIQLWYDNVTPMSRQTDLDYISGMRPHHEGALTMAEIYLRDADASSPALKQIASSIIHNQKFEIGVLSMLEAWATPALAVDNHIRIIAEGGQAQQHEFMYAPAPALGVIAAAPVSQTDVAFAKAMIEHHEGALMMARDYLADPNATNDYLRLLNGDILTDQSQEIALMHRIIGYYDGDAAAIKPAKIYGMEHMQHGTKNNSPSMKQQCNGHSCHKNNHGHH